MSQEIFTVRFSNKKYAAVLSPHGHLKDKRFTDYVQLRSAYLASKGAIVFAYDMVGYGESKQIRHKCQLVFYYKHE